MRQLLLQGLERVLFLFSPFSCSIFPIEFVGASCQIREVSNELTIVRHHSNRASLSSDGLWLTELFNCSHLTPVRLDASLREPISHKVKLFYCNVTFLCLEIEVMLCQYFEHFLEVSSMFFLTLRIYHNIINVYNNKTVELLTKRIAKHCHELCLGNW